MKNTPVVMPRTIKYLKIVGEQIKLARLRRDISTKLCCERAGISRSTLWQIEKGSPNVSMGAYVNVLMALGGLDKDILLIAKDDIVGRTYQDLNIKVKKRIDD